MPLSYYNDAPINSWDRKKYVMCLFKSKLMFDIRIVCIYIKIMGCIYLMTLKWCPRESLANDPCRWNCDSILLYYNCCLRRIFVRKPMSQISKYLYHFSNFRDEFRNAIDDINGTKDHKRKTIFLYFLEINGILIPTDHGRKSQCEANISIS